MVRGVIVPRIDRRESGTPRCHKLWRKGATAALHTVPRSARVRCARSDRGESADLERVADIGRARALLCER
jgi:hypothetical protein